MKKRNLSGLKKKRDYLVTWLERFKESKDAIPYIHESLELTDWEIDTLENLPNKENMEESNEDDYYDTNIDYLANSLPMLPEINIESVFNIVVASTSGSSQTYALVSGFPLTNEDLTNYRNQRFTIYHEIQAKLSRVEDVKTLIEKFGNDNLNQRFDKAYDGYNRTISGIEEKSSAALEMRNLLDGIKGELFALARDNDKQNMTWEIMTDKLHRGHEDGSEKTEILNQEVIRSKLIDDLSKTLKDRESKIPVAIEDLWTRTIDHLYVLLNSIKTNA